MSIDSAILVANSEKLVPSTVRFYGWKPSAISIGYFQKLGEEIDVDACRNSGVDYVRRITGGGAVFHEHELTYSIIIPENHPKISKNILESYGLICGAIMKGLSHLDIKSSYAPINDILVHGKKISGNAQTRKHHTILQHGTILNDVNIEKMFSLLKVSDEKIKDKMIANVKDRVTSIKHQKQKTIPFEEIALAMKKGFEETFNVSLKQGKLIEEEERLTEEYKTTCFRTETWNHQR
jgi:lipoate-protein ligase A